MGAFQPTIAMSSVRAAASVRECPAGLRRLTPVDVLRSAGRVSRTADDPLTMPLRPITLNGVLLRLTHEKPRDVCACCNLGAFPDRGLRRQQVSGGRWIRLHRQNGALTFRVRFR